MKKKLSVLLLSCYVFISVTTSTGHNIGEIAGFAAKYADGWGSTALTACSMALNYAGGLAVAGVFTAPEGVALCVLGG
jgi:hypothetical protein